MDAWLLKVVYVKTVLDPATQKPRVTWRNASDRLEVPALPLEEAKAKARTVLASRGLNVRQIVVAVAKSPTLIAYVNEGASVPAIPERGSVFKFPPKPVKL